MVSELSDYIDEIVDAIREAEEQIAFELSWRGSAIARKLTAERLPSKGGSFRSSIRFEVRRRDDGFEGVLFSDHPYASHIEVGTRPHEIRARSTKSLHIEKIIPGGSRQAPFGTRYARVNLFRKKVLHPGARAFHIFRDTFIELRKALNTIIEKALREAGFT